MASLLPDLTWNYAPIIAVMAWWLFLCRERPVRQWIANHAWGWVGVGTALASPMLARLFTLADDIETARMLWHWGLLGTLVMYLVILALIRRYWMPVLAAAVAAGALFWFRMEGLHMEGYGRHMASAVLLLAITCVVAEIFVSMSRAAIFERLIWAIRLVAEGFAVVEFGMCQGLRLAESQAWLAQAWGIDGSKFVCGRAFGEWFAHAPLILTGAVMTWVILAYRRAAKHAGQR